MRWPYEQIGVTTTRAFRNLLNKIHGDIADDMQEHKDRADNIQAQVDNLVADGDSSPEAAQARVGADGTNYTTLKQRLDTEHADVTAQLAEDVQKRGDLSKLGSDPQDLATALSQVHVNPLNFGCKGDGATDDTVGLLAADAFACTINRPLYLPCFFAVSKTVKLQSKLIYGAGMVVSGLVAIADMDIVLDRHGIDRAAMRDFMVDGNSLANVCIDTGYDKVGPSLNLSIERVFCRGYKQWGWLAENNNDVYFDKIFIAEPADYSTSKGAIKAWGAGGPFQFNDCNFLDKAHVGGQIISFNDCVTRGIAINGPGFNNIKLNGGYLTPSKDHRAVIEIEENNEAGPITFFGSHSELSGGFGTYLVGGSGKLHYGIDYHGGHIFNPDSDNGQGGLLAGILDSSFTKAVSKFENVRFERCYCPDEINDFILSYENCYADGVPISGVRTGDLRGYFENLNNRINIGANQNNKGLSEFTATISNVGNGYLPITADLSGAGVYIVMLNSESQDAPRAIFMIGMPGNYGESIVRLMSAPGVGNYAGLEFNIINNAGTFEVNATGSTGSLSVVPTVRFAIICLGK